MPCYHPIDAWRSAEGVSHRPTPDFTHFKHACGRCIGCRLERSRNWALRLVHEKRFHEDSSFITLTYDEEHLPPSGSLDVKHFQDFMKRLRFDISPKRVRFFHAGEYGEKRRRPHYHAIIFGESFSCGVCHLARPHRCHTCGAYEFEESARGDVTWRSPLLDRLWPSGLARVGDVTFESCAYVARYVTKKKTGREAVGHYERISEVDGEIFSLKPEYCTMSRRPGIGALHFEKHVADIYRGDFVLSRGRRSLPPKFYDKLLEKSDPELYADVKDRRECALLSAPKQDRTVERLADRETVKLAQMCALKRRYEIG